MVPISGVAMSDRAIPARYAWFSRRLRYALILCVGLGAVALYLLSTATANTALFARHYPTLLAVNGALVLVLVALVAYQLARLGRRLRRQEFGSRLALRFVLLLALMSLLPGVLVYAISVKFLARSIESWFEVRVDKALDAGLNLGRGTLDGMLKELAAKADAMTGTLSRLPAPEQVAALNGLREQAGVEQATLFTSRGRVIGFAGNERAGLMPDNLSQQALRQTRQQQRYAGIESGAERGLYLRVVVPLDALSLSDEARALQLVQPVPAQLAADAETVQTGYREYQELLLARVGLKRLYGVTLTLALLVALLSAFLLAIILSEKLAAPLATLARGTRAVAQGDFTQYIPVQSRDELGVLTQSFNTMTEQLSEARESAERHQGELASAKTYLESLLAHLSAGVMSFDRELRLRSANPSASAILQTRLDALMGAKLRDLCTSSAALSPVVEAIETGFETGATPEWERQVSMTQGALEKSLLLRGTGLGSGTEDGYVVVFDDISHVIQAQRQAAWSEVARRLAHEIKNPLTPIQLSAERLQLKLADKLPRADAEMLGRSTRLIVDQVAALNSMVDAFSQYARSPEPKLQPLDLNQLTREILGLYESLGRSMHLKLAANLPLVSGDARLLRQVFHNLVQNAQDALADVPDPRIVVTSEDTGRTVRLTIEDNGCGFPEHLMQRVFEPYVTTKQKGTGLGLSIVKKIIEDHGGSVAIENLRPHGARVSIELPRRAEVGPRAVALG
jgi:nitrogen fixation/metabolism regulation signal transduction histidine kinase